MLYLYQYPCPCSCFLDIPKPVNQIPNPIASNAEIWHIIYLENQPYKMLSSILAKTVPQANHIYMLACWVFVFKVQTRVSFARKRVPDNVIDTGVKNYGFLGNIGLYISF